MKKKNARPAPRSLQTGRSAGPGRPGRPTTFNQPTQFSRPRQASAPRKNKPTAANAGFYTDRTRARHTPRTGPLDLNVRFRSSIPYIALPPAIPTVQTVHSHGVFSVASQTELQKALASKHDMLTIILVASFSLTEPIVIPADKEVKLISGGGEQYTLKRKVYSHLITVSERGELTTHSIIIDGNRYDYPDGGGALLLNYGTLTIQKDTALRNNTVNGSGSGIINAGYLAFQGGEITDNSAHVGAGILNGGTAVMTGGTIYNNVATGDGDAIFNAIDSSFTQEGGTVDVHHIYYDQFVEVSEANLDRWETDEARELLPDFPETPSVTLARSGEDNAANDPGRTDEDPYINLEVRAGYEGRTPKHKRGRRKVYSAVNPHQQVAHTSAVSDEQEPSRDKGWPTQPGWPGPPKRRPTRTDPSAPEPAEEPEPYPERPIRRPERPIRPLPERPARPEGPNRPERPTRPERPERPDRPARPERPEHPARPERPERPERPARPERPERPERPARPERPERPERPARPERPERPEGPERPLSPDRPGRPERTDRPGHPPYRPDRPNRPERPTRPERPRPPYMPNRPGYPPQVPGTDYPDSRSRSYHPGRGDVSSLSGWAGYAEFPGYSTFPSDPTWQPQRRKRRPTRD